MSKKAFVAYIDENDNKRQGIVELISLDINSVTFKTNSNTITIPILRILKIKEEVK